MPAQLTMYSTSWCGYCHRLARQLKQAGIEFQMVDIEEQPEATAIVESANDGNRTVPTVVFTDGTSLTNPSVREVQAKLAD
ncbi:MAG: mycoredoxin [Propionibacteriales bacterium]|nr:mycoredoxin [Propionibacteriales bacterium]